MPAIPASSIGTSVPTYDMNGLVSGYSGTSRYGGAAASADFPTYGPNGTVINYYSKTPYTGTYNGIHVANGKVLQLDPVTGNYMTAEDIAQRNAKIQNDPSQRYQAVDVIKSPEVAGATANLLAEYKKSADSALKDFSDYLNTFKSDMSQARDLGKQATDIAPVVNNLRNLNTNYSNELNDASSRYSNALATGAQNEQNIIQEAKNALPQYDAAAQAVADRQQQALTQQISRYKLGTGTPTGLGSDELLMQAQGTRDIQLPVQLAKIGRQYDIMNNLELPVSRDITNRDIGYSGSFLPGVAGSRYTAGTGTENAIQSLRMQIAGMSYDNAMRYMQAAGVPFQLQDAILRGQIGELGGLAQLEDQSRYRGLQDRLGVNVSQPQNYSVSLPAPPTYSPMLPSGGYGGNYFTPISAPTSTASTAAAANTGSSGYGMSDDQLNALLSNPATSGVGLTLNALNSRYA